MVVERISRIPLADLTTIRITCKKCNRTAETTVDDAAMIPAGRCALCNERFFDTRGGGNDPFEALGSAMRRFEELADKFAIEFVIPDNGQEGQS
jgi:hypothetical protein